MVRLAMLIKVIFATILCASSIQGWAQTTADGQPVDCRSCHLTKLAPGAKDFSSIYADISSHHPVDINYPASIGVYPEFKQPGKQLGNVTFFDSNRNGLPDSDEVQLFGKVGAPRIACASCHREHGNDPAPAGSAPNYHLRVDNISSALCITCHSK